MSYGGRDEIVQGIKKIISKGIKLQDITQKTVSDNLWLPDIDVIIRTGGEQRLSGFLPWQSVYAELFLLKNIYLILLPKILKQFYKNILKRQRRFGK